MKTKKSPLATKNASSTICFLEKLPFIHPKVYKTKNGTLYLKDPGVVMLSAPAVDLTGLSGFLSGFPKEYEFDKYLADRKKLAPAEQLVKVAGQVCYASYGPKRTMNKDVDRYINNLVSSGHGSVLEHANFTILFYGVSRSMTHEFVRHRAGMAFSQLSQRYVSGRVLRFVERPEYQTNRELHKLFEERIDRAYEEYEAMAQKLLDLQEKGDKKLSAEAKTDARKRVQQTARSLLPNETETVIAATGNVRAWRHIISMRANEHAETEIRKAIFSAFKLLKKAAPVLFSDFRPYSLPDGTMSVTTDYPKV